MSHENLPPLQGATIEDLKQELKEMENEIGQMLQKLRTEYGVEVREFSVTSYGNEKVHLLELKYGVKIEGGTAARNGTVTLDVRLNRQPNLTTMPRT